MSSMLARAFYAVNEKSRSGESGAKRLMLAVRLGRT